MDRFSFFSLFLFLLADPEIVRIFGWIDDDDADDAVYAVISRMNWLEIGEEREGEGVYYQVECVCRFSRRHGCAGSFLDK